MAGQGKSKKHIVRSKKLKKPSKGEKKKARSAPGFIGAGLGLFAFIGWTVWSVFAKEKEDREYSKKIRTRLASKPLVFSDHASCRMDCRHVGMNDVVSTLQSGRVNSRKSNPAARPCPKYALDKGRVQAVFADCATSTPVVTVIDTHTNHPCGPC
ncbi:hypothetical protein CYMTET_5986 [Cymbomonas tetramitiformis]|uniref:DUF4258 domain-containing protein n=1 Tax=Cymbomonas tetramitiformis TaxID=36881 RepID=A0AAE0H012_9CHLO|nr:hypothetical protein CYMTET_5986 [Cymbomonas tetramitiformis]